MNWLKNQKYSITIFFVVLIILVIIGGLNLQKAYHKNIIESVENELTSIAQLKIDEISSWYNDQFTDLEDIAHNYNLIENIEQLVSGNQLTNIQHKALQQIENRFSSLLAQHSLSDIILLDNSRNVITSTLDQEFTLDEQIEKALNISEDSNAVISTGIYHCKIHDAIHIDFARQILNENNQELGYLILVVDAEEFLYPYIQKWPIPSQTAETLILTLEDDHVLFLNELRHIKGSALNLRIPLTRNDVPAVKAVKGYTGVTWGIDYRDVEVLSYVAKIPSTPWYIVSKIDKEEMFDRPFLVRYMSIVIPSILIMLLLAGLAFLMMRRQKNFYKMLYLTQQEFRTILYSIGDGVIVTNEEGRILHFNETAEKVTGWTELEALNKKIEEVFPLLNEYTRETVENPVQIVREKGIVVNLANHTLLITKDGREVPIADSGAPILGEDGSLTGVILVFRDQTIERAQQKQLEEHQRRLSTIMSNLPGVAYRCKNDESWTMEFISKVCYELTGYTDEDLINNAIIAYNDIIVDEFKAEVWSIVEQAIENKQVFELEYQIITKSGQIKWIWERGQGVFDESGLVAIEGLLIDIDYRKQTEAALVESEQVFQTLAENSPVGIFKTDANGQTIYVNPKWCEIAGLGEQEALGTGWLKYIHPEDREGLIQNWQNKISEHLTAIDEYRFLHQNGKLVYVKGQAVPEFDQQNHLKGYIGTITDVTDLKNTQTELLNTNNLLRTIIDNIPDAIYLKDKEGHKVLANKADVKNAGLNSEQELIGKTDFDMYPLPIAKQFWEMDLKVFKSGEPVLNHEEVISNHRGEEKWLSTSKMPYMDSNGKVIGLVGIGHDITQRKQAEEERSKLFKVISQSPVSIVITDLNGDIEFVNPKFTEITGYTFDEVKGKNPRILKSGQQSEDFYKTLWENIASGKEFTCELHNKKKNGELFWERAIIAPIKNSSGNIINYVAVKEDISDKKILMRELLDAKDRAEQSERLKSSFLANMSHEIRTPLNSILGFTSILLESDDLTAQEKREYISIINKGSDSLLQIINDIIDLSRLETGQMQIVPTKFNINELLQMLYKEFNKRISDVSRPAFELRLLTADKDIQLFTDVNRLNQIITNLLTNAIKFTLKGHIEFGIEKYDNNYVYFIAEDTGIGIDEADQKIIFERFRQAEDKNNRQFGGNGLGLSIVKNLVELMGGEIFLDSKPGKGSTFRFYLPYKYVKRTQMN